MRHDDVHLLTPDLPPVVEVPDVLPGPYGRSGTDRDEDGEEDGAGPPAGRRGDGAADDPGAVPEHPD